MDEPRPTDGSPAPSEPRSEADRRATDDAPAPSEPRSAADWRAAGFPPGLLAPGSEGAPFRVVLAAAELPAGEMRRVTHGDLDVLVAHTPDGVVAVDDRCPHMAAPLSLGRLDGCVVSCPLHDGRFDLRSGDPVQMPTTGGLDADGTYHPTWAAAGRDPKPDVPGLKAEARRLTRVRRFRYYRVRVADGLIAVAIPD